MAHVAKYNKGAMGHMMSHYDRSKDGMSGYIDSDRTHLNYNLATHQSLRQLDFVHKRLNEVYCMNRKDVNVVCDWVVTMPKDLDSELTRDFMQASYDFMAARYGRENVISAYVHMDETSPHIHFAFVPVTYDPKNGRNKVSAKEVVNRHDLQTFHTDLQRHLEEVLEREVHVLNEATAEGNRSIQELKRGTAQQKLAELEEDITDLQQDLAVLQGKHGKLLTASKQVAAAVLEQNNRLVAGREKLADLQQDVTQTQQQALSASQELQEAQNALQGLQSELEAKEATKKRLEAEIKAHKQELVAMQGRIRTQKEIEAMKVTRLPGGKVLMNLQDAIDQRATALDRDRMRGELITKAREYERIMVNERSIIDAARKEAAGIVAAAREEASGFESIKKNAQVMAENHRLRQALERAEALVPGITQRIQRELTRNQAQDRGQSR